MKSIRRRTDMDRIIRTFLHPAQSPISLDEPDSSSLQQLPPSCALLQIPLGQVDQRLDVIDPDDLATGLHEFGEDVSEIAGSRADIEDLGAGVEVREQRLAGRGVHVGSGDGRRVADALRRILVRSPRSVVCAIDLLRRW